MKRALSLLLIAAVIGVSVLALNCGCVWAAMGGEPHEATVIMDKPSEPACHGEAHESKRSEKNCCVDCRLEHHANVPASPGLLSPVSYAETRLTPYVDRLMDIPHVIRVHGGTKNVPSSRYGPSYLTEAALPLYLIHLTLLI